MTYCSFASGYYSYANCATSLKINIDAWLIVTETKVLILEFLKNACKHSCFVQNVKMLLRDMGTLILIHWTFTHIKTKVH